MLRFFFESKRKKQVCQTTEGNKITMIIHMFIQITCTRLRNPDWLKLSKEMKPPVHLLFLTMFLRLIYKFISVVTGKVNLRKKFEGKGNKP